MRYYPKRGTVHFFPRSKELMDRLNLVVGKRRQWLPPNMDTASSDFQKQYEQAEKFDAEVRKAFAKSSDRSYGRSYGDYGSLLLGMKKGADVGGSYAASALAAMDEALDTVLAAHDIHPFAALETHEPEQLLLAA